MRASFLAALVLLALLHVHSARAQAEPLEAELVAVLDLEPDGASQSEAQALSVRLRTELLRRGGVRVLDLGHLAGIPRAEVLRDSHCSGHGCAAIVGRNLKVSRAGQLGLGDTADRGDGSGEMGDNLPIVDLGTGRTASAIAAGTSHSCALLDNNQVKCWGGNSAGQLGLGDNNDRGVAAGEMGDNLPAVNPGTGRHAIAIDAGGVYDLRVAGQPGSSVGETTRRANWGGETPAPAAPTPATWGTIWRKSTWGRSTKFHQIR